MVVLTCTVMAVCACVCVCVRVCVCMHARVCVGGRACVCNSCPQHKMELNGQLHALDTLFLKLRNYVWAEGRGDGKREKAVTLG
jgi:hypothetical protein